jgi:signal transduction histidine kinase
MEINKEKLLYQTHQKFMETGFNSPKSLNILDDLVVPDIMGFGTTVDERIFSVADLKELIKRQREQSKGLEIKWVANPVMRKVLTNENVAIFVDDVEIDVTIVNDTIKIFLRYSSVIEYQSDKWVVIHFHGSKPENVKTEEDTWGIEDWKNKNAELEKLVKERTSELEKSLAHLKATQTQLVQQEKLASLGALTAGIAHEIKNPLNFVNNFSELSTDLVDEFIQTTDETERQEIGADLKINLQKINEHGKRADSIVKNMLQHSRSGSGEKQPIDINQLCDEYFNLAFHGKHATDAGFNCEMVKSLDYFLPQVNCVVQDISRVILNLVNNAFDAVRECELEGKTPNYKPSVTLSTQQINNTISISISDNGKGIPLHIKEKIFEPFFTTKPAGQGTGLGLSLSYDIVKAHGGEMKLETKEWEGSEFVILIPNN